MDRSEAKEESEEAKNEAERQEMVIEITKDKEGLWRGFIIKNDETIYDTGFMGPFDKAELGEDKHTFNNVIGSIREYIKEKDEV
ncbi:MAG: hypothetical protein V5A64_06525 [Candidatus Thermoplasmatota archaeon]